MVLEMHTSHTHDFCPPKRNLVFLTGHYFPEKERGNPVQSLSFVSCFLLAIHLSTYLFLENSIHLALSPKITIYQSCYMMSITYSHRKWPLSWPLLEFSIKMAPCIKLPHRLLLRKKIFFDEKEIFFHLKHVAFFGSAIVPRKGYTLNHFS